MEETYISEKSVLIYKIARRYIPEDSNIHNQTGIRYSRADHCGRTASPFKKKGEPWKFITHFMLL
jgi:hypothetical protein